jgi:phosphoribosylamine--glycine ligase/phosphoribosylformylglycinamidine cyclo-ligase
LIGGETAEMPGMYHADDYDLAGFAVGAVERSQILPRPDITAGDVLIGIASSGPHSNGYSLIRKVVTLAGLDFADPAPWSPNQSVGDALLTPTRIYIKQLLPGIKAGLFKGMSHITGGGFTENIPRIFEKDSGLGVSLDISAWTLPDVWKWIMKTGNISPTEMARTFNCGVGMVIIVGADQLDQAMSSLKANGEEAFIMGQVVAQPGVQYEGLERWN